MLSLKNLWRRKTRTLLTTLGIAIGVAAVVILSAFGEGMARGFGQAGVSADSDLLVTQRDAIMLIVGAIDEEVGAELQQIRGIDAVAGAVVGILQLPDSPYFLVTGEEPRSFAMAHYRLIEGRAISAKREVMLGRQSAENLKKRIGDRFRIGDISYRVVGIYETGSSFEDNGAVLGLADAQRAFDKRGQVSFFRIALRDLREREQIRQQIEERWPDLAVLRSGEPGAQEEVLQLYRSMGWILGVFAVLVGGLGMMNAMLMSVFERTREIGVLRAMGWRRRRVVLMILGEALLLSALGGLIGLGLGVLLIWGARSSPAVSGFLGDAFDPSMAIQAFFIAIILGLVGGGYPALRAASLAPVEAMRAESGAAVRWGPIARLLSRVLRGATLRDLLRRPTRSLMTIAGVGVGVGFIVAISGITVGAERLIVEMLSAGQADILAEQAGASDMSFSTIEERDVDLVRLHPEVRSVSRMVLGTSNVPGLPFFIIYGLDPREEYLRHYYVTEGRTIQRPGEILLGRLAANSLEKEVGEKLRLAGASFTIVGIFETGVGYEDSGGVITLREAQRLFGKPRQVSFLSIAVTDPSRAAIVAAELEARIPSLLVARTSDLTSRVQDFATMDAVFGALIGLMLVVGGIVMMNVMLMSVFERTQEIGVLRAVGWSARRVLRMVMAESVALSILSAFAGAGIGVGLTWLLTLAPYYGAVLQPGYTADIFVQVFLMAIGLGVLGGLLPAWRAVRLAPVEALHYE
jgi:ABC-type antimicrobial peptide transport system permease subunit